MDIDDGDAFKVTMAVAPYAIPIFQVAQTDKDGRAVRNGDETTVSYGDQRRRQVMAAKALAEIEKAGDAAEDEVKDASSVLQRLKDDIDEAIKRTVLGKLVEKLTCRASTYDALMGRKKVGRSFGGFFVVCAPLSCVSLLSRVP